MIKELFEAITPENIKSIPLISDAMEIFIENLEERSKISTNIREIYNPDNTTIYENLIKTYLVNLYDVLYNIKNDPDYIELLNSKFPDNISNKDLKDVINNEYFLNAKLIKQKKGTISGIKYAYNFGKSLENDSTSENVFQFKEGLPFHYSLDGSILKETYEHVVIPLAHPLGFTYDYRQVIQESIVDFLGTSLAYKIDTLEVRCISGNIDIFTENANDSLIKPKVLKYTNLSTGKLYTEEEYNTLVTIYYNKKISSYSENEIIFDDDTILKRITSPKQIYYRNLADEELDNDNYIREYVSNCSIYKNINVDYKFNFYDEVTILSNSDSTLNDTYSVETFEDIFEIYDTLVKFYLFSTDNFYLYTDDGRYLIINETTDTTDFSKYDTYLTDSFDIRLVDESGIFLIR